MKTLKISKELHDFVVNQAAQDRTLPARELSHQEEIVKDVLGQEAPSKQAFKSLIDLYHAEKRAA
ncbi:MAG TPA: hypothetical protein VLF88_00475 [Candidatus Babeliales bacterium]|nr:hypothetical protein [Candidatus Babeliales bacterium]